MRLSVDFDRKTPALRAFSAFATPAPALAAVKGALHLATGKQSLTARGELFLLVEQWLEAVTALQDDPAAQHTLFCEGGALVVERQGNALVVTFDPSLALHAASTDQPPAERACLTIPLRHGLRATLDGIGGFCVQLFALNAALEHYTPMQSVRRLLKQLREQQASQSGLAGVRNHLLAFAQSLQANPWKVAVIATVLLLLVQTRAFQGRVSRLQRQLDQQAASTAARSTKHTKDTKTEKDTKNGRKGDSKGNDNASGTATVRIGIPGAESDQSKGSDSASFPSGQVNARLADRNAAPSRDIPPVLPMPVLPEPRGNGGPDSGSGWRLLGIIEFAGERTALLERVTSSAQERTTLYKHVGESLDPGGWQVSEVLIDRVVLKRKVRAERPPGAKSLPPDRTETVTLTPGQ